MKRNGKAHKVGLYAVIFERPGRGTARTCPPFHGVLPQVTPFSTPLKLVSKAIKMHTAGMRADGLAIPDPTNTMEDTPRTLSLPFSWGGHLAHRNAAKRCTPRKRRA